MTTPKFRVEGLGFSARVFVAHCKSDGAQKLDKLHKVVVATRMPPLEPLHPFASALSEKRRLVNCTAKRLKRISGHSLACQEPLHSDNIRVPFLPSPGSEEGRRGLKTSLAAWNHIGSSKAIVMCYPVYACERKARKCRELCLSRKFLMTGACSERLRNSPKSSGDCEWQSAMPSHPEEVRVAA